MLLTPANSNANQNSYANSDRECGKRAGFGLSCNSTQSIIADPGTDLDCLIPQAGRLVDRCALATTKTVYDVVQDRPDSLGDLIARGGRARGTPSNAARKLPATLFVVVQNSFIDFAANDRLQKLAREFHGGFLHVGRLPL